MTGAPALRARPVVLISSSREHGGAERYLVLLAAALAREGPVVALLAEEAAEQTRGALAGAGARVEIVAGLRRRPSPAAVLRTYGQLRRLRPRLVHVNLSDQGDGLTAIAAAWLARRPRTATLHLALPDRMRAAERLAAVALRRVQPVIAVSDGVGRQLAAAGVPHRVVRNGLPARRRSSPEAARLREEVAGPLVGGVGRLDVQKGWDVLCAAAPLVRAQVPGVAIMVWGDGPERARLEALGAGAGVAFRGYHRDAAALLGAFDVLAIPSRYEGLSLTAIEGLAAGLAIVASDVPGLREAVGDCGLLVAPEDPALLAAALVGLLLDGRRRAGLGRAGAERARTRFGVDRMLAETRAVHAAVLGDGSAR